MTKDLSVDVLIVGSGPVGATYARKLVEAGRNVLMVEMGPQMTPRPGEHLKNAFIFQRNIDMFASIIRGHLNVMSVPSNRQEVMSLDPGAYRIDDDKYKGFVRNNQNPDQDPNKNLPAAAVTYGVGGMATHWTCATPRHHPTMERSDIYDDAEWDRLYKEGERLLNTHADQFDHAIRHIVVRETLAEEYPELPHPYHVQNLPLAVERRRNNPELVHWSGTDTVFGPLADGPLDKEPFVLKDQHRCSKLVPAASGGRIDHAIVTDLLEGEDIRVKANLFIVCANAYCTPQILFASGIRPEPLGRWLTEQPVSFCQIVLRGDIIDDIEADPRFKDRVAAHRAQEPGGSAADPDARPGAERLDPGVRRASVALPDPPRRLRLRRSAAQHRQPARRRPPLVRHRQAAPRKPDGLLGDAHRRLRHAAADLRVGAGRRGQPQAAPDDEGHAARGERAGRLPAGLGAAVRGAPGCRCTSPGRPGWAAAPTTASSTRTPRSGASRTSTSAATA